ncbi:unnamed protein product [Urochloa decumbens]|uniref:F-box domain-containing protein n=1 Tax=Urochloa decumbens TaxID=240449 RepID=A0ABC9FKB9_9POAL
MAAAAPAPALMEEIIEQILIRLPPAEPASLVRAALVCKPWCRLIAGRGFRRRFREFHRAPPMLGLICNRVDENFYSIYLARFVPTTCSFRPRRVNRRDWRALDARHGRVLLRGMTLAHRHLIVWDPVTKEWIQLPNGPELVYYWNAAVLCAAYRSGATCDHLDCHGGPFVVVFLGTSGEHMTLWVYSSEAGAWKKPTSIVQFPKYHIDESPSAIVGNALYFVIDNSRKILKYDLATREISVILQPPASYRSRRCCTTIMTMEDCGLGVARMEESRLSLWSMEANLDGGMGWALVRVIDVQKLLSVTADSICYDFLGFAHGAGVLFVGTCDGLFSFDLKTGQARKVCEDQCHFNGIRGVIPFMSFHTPALGAVSTDD